MEDETLVIDAPVDPFDEVRAEMAAEEAAADPIAPEANVSDGTEPEAEEADGNRRGRGGLELDVREITNAFTQGEIELKAGDFLTPHRISALVQSRLGAKASTGAVSNVLKRWYEIGFAVVNEKPFAFLDYTDAARLEGLTALKEKAREGRKAAVAEVKAAAAPEVSAPDAE